MRKKSFVKRSVAVVLTGAMAMSCMAGCGSGGSENKDGNGEKQGSGDEVVHLQFWGGTPAENGFTEMQEAFNSTHDDIQIEYVYYTNDDAGNTKLDMSLMAGGDADLFISYNDSLLQKRIEAGNTLPLTDFLEKYDLDPAEAFGEGVRAYEKDGVYHMLPTITSNNCILYNQTMFEEAGVPLPEADWTYDEFLAAAEALTTDEVYGFYFPAWEAGQPATEFAKRALGDNWMYNDDGTAVQIDRPEVRQSFQDYMDRMEAGIEVDFVDNKTQQMTPEDMFLQGKAAMVYANWIVRNVKDTETYPHDFVTGFTNVPRISEDQEALYTGGISDYMSINSKSEHIDEAMEFMYWYITEGVGYLAKYGRIGAYSGLDRAKIAEDLFGESSELFDMDEAEVVYLTPGDISPRTITAASAEINTILTEEFEKAFAGEQSVEEAITTAQERAQKAFEEAQPE